MLSDKDKAEMLADSKSTLRKKAFAYGSQFLQQNTNRSLTSYIQFLQEMQVFFPSPSAPHKTVTSYNRL